MTVNAEINMFKSGGVIYKSKIVKIEKTSIKSQDALKEFIYDQLPTRFSNGYVLITISSEDTKEMRLYKTNDLKKRVEHLSYVRTLDYTQLSILDLV